MRNYNTPGSEFTDKIESADVPGALDLVAAEGRKLLKMPGLTLDKETIIVLAAKRLYTAIRMAQKSVAE